MKTLVIAEIHDSIISDCPENEVQDYLTLAERVMTQDLRQVWKWIVTPMGVEADVTPIGESWNGKKPWVNRGGVWEPK